MRNFAALWGMHLHGLFRYRKRFVLAQLMTYMAFALVLITAFFTLYGLGLYFNENALMNYTFDIETGTTSGELSGAISRFTQAVHADSSVKVLASPSKEGPWNIMGANKLGKWTGIVVTGDEGDFERLKGGEHILWVSPDYWDSFNSITLGFDSILVNDDHFDVVGVYEDSSFYDVDAEVPRIGTYRLTHSDGTTPIRNYTLDHEEGEHEFIEYDLTGEPPSGMLLMPLEAFLEMDLPARLVRVEFLNPPSRDDYQAAVEAFAPMCAGAIAGMGNWNLAGNALFAGMLAVCAIALLLALAQMSGNVMMELEARGKAISAMRTMGSSAGRVAGMYTLEWSLWQAVGFALAIPVAYPIIEFVRVYSNPRIGMRLDQLWMLAAVFLMVCAGQSWLLLTRNARKQIKRVKSNPTPNKRLRGEHI